MLLRHVTTRSAARLTTGLLALCIFLVGLVHQAQAQIGSGRYSSIVIDAASGNVLSASNPDDMRFPASLTKMMTIYMLFEAVRDHRVTLNQYVPVSPVAASMSPTKLGLVPGSLITVEQCLLGLVTKSANDAAAALGEMLGGDEDRFAQMMTLRAHALGMSNTTFRNASGLPDWSQVTTARDMAILARHLIQDFPGFYHYFSTPSFVYGGHIVRSHNAMVATYPGADGLKTGYTDAAGFNVVTSALRGETRLIGVVIGAGSSGERNAHMANLLDMGFDRMGTPSNAYIARREPPVPEQQGRGGVIHLPTIISLARAAPATPLAQPAYQPQYQAPLPFAPVRPVRTGRQSRRDLEPRSYAPRPYAQPSYSARAERPAPAYRPAQARPADMMRVPRPKTNSNRTAHGNPYLRYPG